MPTDITFKSLPEALEDPAEISMCTDFGKFERPGQLHLAFQALHHFKKENGRLPKPWSTEDASQFKVQYLLTFTFSKLYVEKQVASKLLLICIYIYFSL